MSLHCASKIETHTCTMCVWSSLFDPYDRRHEQSSRNPTTDLRSTRWLWVVHWGITVSDKYHFTVTSRQYKFPLLTLEPTLQRYSNLGLPLLNHTRQGDFHRYCPRVMREVFFFDTSVIVLILTKPCEQTATPCVFTPPNMIRTELWSRSITLLVLSEK